MRCLMAILALLACSAAGAEQFVGPAELHAWVDENVRAVVDRGEASAASVAVVRDGQVLLAEHYGWADPVTGVSVDTDNQFKIGSITKTFTGLAVAYLLEQGLIGSIDDPANRYLQRYQLPGEWGEKVTVAHLLTHSSGLDSPVLGITSDDQRDIPASSEFLASRIPPIVREPGTRSAYANYGMAVVQALVEDITGQPFDLFLRERILLPLGMKDSVLGIDRSGGPALVRAGLTRPGEQGRASDYLPLGTNAPFIATSGAMQVTASDMARYMNGHLGFAPEVVTAGMIATQQHSIRSNYPGLSGIGLGIFADDWNGHRVWSHGGLVAGFRSNMVLVPRLGLGAFVVFAGGSDVFNASGGKPGEATSSLLRMALGDYRLPEPLAQTSDPAQFAGTYWNETRAHHSPDMLLALMQVSTVSVDAEGTLRHNGRELTEIEPGLFMVMGQESDGMPPRLLGMNGEEVLESVGYERRVSGFGNPQNWLLLTNGSLALCLTGFAALFYRRGLRAPALLIAAGSAAFLGLVVAHMFSPIALFEIFTGDILWRFRIGSVLAWSLPVLALWCIYSATRRWPELAGFSSRLPPLHVAVVGIAAMVLAVMLHVLQFG